ncbi:MAG: hypothetical protein QW067_12760 [Thermofilaceae archaeon]
MDMVKLKLRYLKYLWSRLKKEYSSPIAFPILVMRDDTGWVCWFDPANNWAGYVTSKSMREVLEKYRCSTCGDFHVSRIVLVDVEKGKKLKKLEEVKFKDFIKDFIYES